MAAQAVRQAQQAWTAAQAATVIQQCQTIPMAEQVVAVGEAVIPLALLVSAKAAQAGLAVFTALVAAVAEEVLTAVRPAQAGQAATAWSLC